jgi:hypothetical protein
MAKELPYFQFEPAEYLTKDISFCTLSAQGLFINICAFYWQRSCELTKTQLLRRFKNDIELNELIEEGVIDLEDDNIIIKFLDIQRDEAINKSNKNSINGAKGGRPKKTKQNPNESEIKANENPNESQTKGIRKDNIKKEDININGKSFTKKQLTDYFLNLFNFHKSEIKRMNANHRSLTPTDENNLIKLIKAGYTSDDFVHGMLAMDESDWVTENNMFTPAHFLRNENFEKYVNTKLRKHLKPIGSPITFES